MSEQIDRSEWVGALERLTGNEASQMKDRLKPSEMRRLLDLNKKYIPAYVNAPFAWTQRNKVIDIEYYGLFEPEVLAIRYKKHLDYIASDKCKASVETSE